MKKKKTKKIQLRLKVKVHYKIDDNDEYKI